MTTPTPQDKGQAMTLPDEIERGKFVGIDLATSPDRTTVVVYGVAYDGETGIGKLYLDALSRISALEAKLESERERADRAEAEVERLREFKERIGIELANFKNEFTSEEETLVSIEEIYDATPFQATALNGESNE